MKTNTLALFDLDHTLLPLDTNSRWVEFLYDKQLVKNPEQAKQQNEEFMRQYKSGTFDVHAYVRFSFSFITQFTTQELARLYDEYYHDCVRPHIKSAALDLVRHHLELGHECVLTSATNLFLIRHVADAFGFEHVIGTRGEKKNGYYTGEFLGLPNFKENKVKNLTLWLQEQGLDWDHFTEIFAYSDSINDVTLLEKATQPFATNPCEKLTSVAKERNWKIIHLFN